MAEPAYFRRLREYVREYMTSVEFPAVQEELWGESDRAFAILKPLSVENSLQRLFLTRLRQGLNSEERKRLYGSDGVLSTFSAKIAMAYAMEFIGPITRDDLDLIRFIRNSFAHASRQMEFKIPEVSAVCAQLRFPDLPNAYGMLGPDGHVASGEHADLTNPRTRYRITCDRIGYGLMLLMTGPIPDVPPEPLL